jgi:putative Mg2+ transporter-C (MgtC) family protein
MPEIGAFLEVVTRIGIAFALGAAIGFERQYRQRAAGLRTNTLVAVGAAVFVYLGDRLGGGPTAAHITAYVVSGVGFLGAGAILKDGASVSGLTTAATLWGAAAVGACAGAGMITEALVAAGAVLGANTTLRTTAQRYMRDRGADLAERGEETCV